MRVAFGTAARAFTLTVIANLVAFAFGPPPTWITYSLLLPFFVLMATGGLLVRVMMILWSLVRR